MYDFFIINYPFPYSAQVSQNRDLKF